MRGGRVGGEMEIPNATNSQGEMKTKKNEFFITDATELVGKRIEEVLSYENSTDGATVLVLVFKRVFCAMVVGKNSRVHLAGRDASDGDSLSKAMERKGFVQRQSAYLNETDEDAWRTHFLRLWSKAVGTSDYDKKEWQKLEERLGFVGIYADSGNDVTAKDSVKLPPLLNSLNDLAYISESIAQWLTAEAKTELCLLIKNLESGEYSSASWRPKIEDHVRTALAILRKEDRTREDVDRAGGFVSFASRKLWDELSRYGAVLGVGGVDDEK